MGYTLNTSGLSAEVSFVPADEALDMSVVYFIRGMDLEAETLAHLGDKRVMAHRVHLVFK